VIVPFDYGTNAHENVPYIPASPVLHIYDKYFEISDQYIIL
jgi:hypothetical protein